MQVQYSSSPLAEIGADVLIVFGFEGAPPRVGEAVDAAIDDLYKTGEFRGKAQESVTIRRPKGFAARAIVIAGCGKAEKCGPAEMRTGAAAALRSVKGKGFRSVALGLTGALASAANIEAAVQGAILGEYEPDVLKTDPTKGERRFETFTLAAPGVTGMEAVFDKGRILGESQNFTRDLVNLPSNLLFPTDLARRAEEMAQAAGLECEVLDEARMRQIGMGSLLAVAQGSTQPPVLIVVRYRPAKSTPRKASI